MYVSVAEGAKHIGTLCYGPLNKWVGRFAIWLVDLQSRASKRPIFKEYFGPHYAGKFFGQEASHLIL